MLTLPASSCICSLFWKLLRVLSIKHTSIEKMVWQEMDDKKRYHLVNWHTVCLPKDCGGLGVLDLTTMNRSLMWKCLWKLKNTQMDLANNAK
jgi:hypothetical protein